MSNPLRVGIIGCGVIAPTHIVSFQQCDGVEVAWACDLKPERAQAIAKRYGIAQATADFRAVLADESVGIISVCTDHASHAELTIAALEAGKHVICEKCLTAHPEQLDAMLAAHPEGSPLKFAGVFQHRFDPINRCVRGIVQRGDLGTILTASAKLRCYRSDAYYGDDWHGTLDQEGGSVLINQAIHFVDQVQWMMGGVASISAAQANLAHQSVTETEDTLTAALRFVNGSLGTLDLTSASHLNWDHGVTLYGTAGTVEMRNDKLHRLECADKDVEARLRAEIEGAENHAGVAVAAEHYGKGHLAQIRDFVDAIRDDRPPYCTAHSAADTARLVFAAYESARTRQWVDLPAPVTA